MYDIENYYQAESVKDAVRLLNEHPDARIISGGSDVLIKIREGKFAGTSPQPATEYVQSLFHRRSHLCCWTGHLKLRR